MVGPKGEQNCNGIDYSSNGTAALSAQLHTTAQAQCEVLHLVEGVLRSAVYNKPSQHPLLPHKTKRLLINIAKSGVLDFTAVGLLETPGFNFLVIFCPFVGPVTYSSLDSTRHLWLRRISNAKLSVSYAYP